MVTREEILDVDKNRPKSDLRVNSGRTEPKDDSQILPHVTQNFEDFSDSLKGRRKYRDVADAALVAFESVAYATAAARSAVELSRSESFDQSSPSSHSKTESYEPKKSKFQTGGEKDSREIQPIKNYHFESGDEEIYIKNKDEDSKHNVNATEFIISASSSGSNSAYGVLKEISSTNSLGKEMVFDKSDDERENEQSGPWGAHESDFDMRYSSVTNDVFYSEKSDNVKHEDISQGQGSGANLTLRSRNDLDVRSAPGNPKSDSAEGSRMQGARRLDAENEPLSVRTRRVSSQMTKHMRGVKL